MTDWNASLYLKFRDERTQPAIDLANRIPHADPRKILDIGCGPGNSTLVLQQRYPQASILGVDSSPAMIETASRDFPEMDFDLCHVPSGLANLDHDYDVVFSNACIQWIPDHRTLIPAFMELLKPGGVLAVQTPMNYDQPIHQLITRVTESSAWKSYFPHPRMFFNLTPGEYFDLFSEIQCGFSLWMTTYYHTMDSHRDILQWYKSTGLKPYLEQLPDDMKPGFEAEILAEIVQGYPAQNNGQVIFRFPRFFFLAVRP